jgi:hypothetical protein
MAKKSPLTRQSGPSVSNRAFHYDSLIEGGQRVVDYTPEETRGTHFHEAIVLPPSTRRFKIDK